MINKEDNSVLSYENVFRLISQVVLFIGFGLALHQNLDSAIDTTNQRIDEIREQQIRSESYQQQFDTLLIEVTNIRKDIRDLNQLTSQNFQNVISFERDLNNLQDRVEELENARE